MGCALRSGFCRSLQVVLCSALLLTSTAHAGLFDDDEARRQIAELRKQTQTLQDTVARAQLDLANQQQKQSELLAALQGQIETLTFRMESMEKKIQDFYLDLDTRVRNLETKGAPVATESATTSAAKPVDPAAEMKAYEAALGLLRANKLKEAIAAFEDFLKNFDAGSAAPNAQFWLASAWGAQGNCKKSVELHQQGLARWPKSPKAPDMLLSMAGCQRDLGQAAEAKKSLELIMAQYPDSAAATTARQRLGKK